MNPAPPVSGKHALRRLRRLVPIVAREKIGSGRRKSLRRLVFVGLLLSLTVGYFAFQPGSRMVGRKLGTAVADFSLRDVLTDQSVSLTQFQTKAAVVLVFTGTSCPVGDLYLPRLMEIAERYKDRGVAFIAVNSNASESVEDVAAHARSAAIVFPVLKDPANKLADQLLAQRTCETLVIDGRSRQLLYQGAIDDQYALGSRKDQPTRHYLTEALDALLTGRTVSVATTPVVGCPIEREVVQARAQLRAAPGGLKSAPELAEVTIDVGNVTYAGEVASILHAKCGSCHRPGQVAPFSLLTYEQARRWATSIGEVVEDRRMPPWQADPRYGHFENDRSLSPRERAVLLAWVEQAAPAGDLATAPKPPNFSEGWTIGSPDLLFEMPESYAVKAEGTLPTQHLRIPTHFTEDVWVQAAEIRPGDRAVVHHIFVFIDDHSKGADGKPNPKTVLVGYAPGDMPSIFPPGVAKKIPAGSDLKFEIHYTPIGQVRYDRSSIGLVIATRPPEHRALTRGISDKALSIPAGVANHVSRSSWTFVRDAHLLSFMPHMHLRGKDFIYNVTYPNGRTEPLLSVPAYDFAWQSVYRLSEPLSLPRGTRIDCLAHFDNSLANLANPDPTQVVRWGEQTFDEMMIGYIDYYEDGPLDRFPPAGRDE